MIAPFSVAVGLMLLSVALWDAFSTIVLPRTVGVALRPARLFYGLGWRLWRVVGSWYSNRRTRQSFLTAFGPLSRAYSAKGRRPSTGPEKRSA